MTYEDAVISAFDAMGVDVLGNPNQLVGYLKDVCDECPELDVLEFNCDEVLLGPFLEVAREAEDARAREALDLAATRGALERATHRTRFLLMDKRHIESDVAKSICNGLAAAVSREFGLDGSSELPDAPTRPPQPPQPIVEAMVSVPDQTYTGKSLEPEPKVVFDGCELVRGRDYDVHYQDNVGKRDAESIGKVVISGMGAYTGTKSASFRIAPASQRRSRLVPWLVAATLVAALVVLALSQVRTVSFDGNGADGGSAPAAWRFGDGTIELPENGFTRDGYEFVGWGDSPDSKSASYAPGSPFFVAGQSRLYAVWSEIQRMVAVSAGGSRTVALRSDGTVQTTVSDISESADVTSWDSVDVVSTGNGHTVALCSDGTVLASGSNYFGQCSVSDWKNVVDVSAGWSHTVALCSDGTVLATGDNDHGQCDVSSWTDVAAVSAGVDRTVAVRSNGTVLVAGYNEDELRDECSSWSDVVAVSSGNSHVVALRSDGTVLAAGGNYFGQANVSDWTDVVAVSAGHEHTVALRSDGTVLATGYNNDGECNVSAWTDVVAVSAGHEHTVALRSDGTVLATGSNVNGQCDVSNW